MNIPSAYAITFLRYDPVTGDALRRQEFAPNFVNSIGARISNTVRAKGADITADGTGRVFVTGAAGANARNQDRPWAKRCPPPFHTMEKCARRFAELIFAKKSAMPSERAWH